MIEKREKTQITNTEKREGTLLLTPYILKR